MADEALYQRVNVLEQKSAVREEQVKTLEEITDCLTKKLEEMSNKLTDIQLTLMKRLPAWGVLMLTTLCSLCTGLIVYVVTKH